MSMVIRNTARLLAIALMLCLTAIAIPAQTKSWQIDKDRLSDARKDSREAAKVLNEIMSKPDKAIPKELLEQAEAVAVFPGVLKAAFIFGGRGGDGVVSRRTRTGWSAPAFFKMGGGSFGAQIGASKTDYVLLFMNEGALKGLLEDKFEIGGEAGVSAGPIGRAASVSSNVTLDAAILSYSRSKGAFIGAALKGVVINPDNDLNEAIYGMKARDLLTGKEQVLMQKVPQAVLAFPETLTRYSKREAAHATMVRFPVTSANVFQGRIVREVRHELLTLPYYDVFDWLEFEVRSDSTVILRGQVVSPPDTKGRAEARVKNIEGVRQVINEIEVLPVSPNDDRLRRALYRAIFNQNSPLFRYSLGVVPSIHIVVKNARATLEGIVESEADKNLAYIRARGVSGLFAVENNLRVQGRDELY